MVEDNMMAWPRFFDDAMNFSVAKRRPSTTKMAESRSSSVINLRATTRPSSLCTNSPTLRSSSGWSGEAFITNYWLRLQEFSSNSSEYQSTESHSHAATSDSIEAEGEFEPSLLLVITVFTLPTFVASLILAQDPVYNVAFLADRLRTLLIYACIAIVPLSVLYWVIHMAFHPVDNWWIWQLQLWIFNWDSCAGLTACYDEHGRPCQWVAPLAKDYCASLDELYG